MTCDSALKCLLRHQAKWLLRLPAASAQVALALINACRRTFARLAEDPKFHFSQILNPGEIEIIHNPTILHSRGDVQDGEVCPAAIEIIMVAF